MKKAAKSGISIALIACMIFSAFPSGAFADNQPATASSNVPPLIVTEVVQNSANEANTGQDGFDAIEIYNTTDNDIDLSNYALAQKLDYVAPFAMTSVCDPKLYSPTYTGINKFTATSSYTAGEVADTGTLIIHSHDTKAVWIKWTPSSVTSPSSPYYALKKDSFVSTYGITDTSRICYAEYPKNLSGSSMTASLTQYSASYTAGSNFFLDNLAYIGQASPAGTPGNTARRGILYIVKNTATASTDKNHVLTNDSDIVSTAYYMRASTADNNKSIDLFYDPVLGVSYTPANSDSEHVTMQTATIGTGLKSWQIPGSGDNNKPVITNNTAQYFTGTTPEIQINGTATDETGLNSFHVMYRQTGSTAYKSSLLSNNCCMIKSAPVKSSTFSCKVPLNLSYYPFNGSTIDYYITAEDSSGNITYAGTPDSPLNVALGSAEDKSAAQDVIDLITALSGTDKNAVKSARSAYESLSTIQKLLVTNYNTLVSYESKLYNYGLLISEALPDPSLANSNDNTEFVEVYVTGDDPVPLADLQLKVGSSIDKYFLTEGEGPTLLQPHQTYVFAMYMTDSSTKSFLKYTSESDKAGFWAAFASNSTDFGNNLSLDKAHRIIVLQCDENGTGISGAGNLPNSYATTLSLYSIGKAATVASSTYNGEKESSPDIAAGKTALFKQAKGSITATIYQPKANATPGTILPGQLLSSDAGLASITVPVGTISPSFNTNTTAYTVTLPHGTKSAPSVSANASSTFATIAYTQAASTTGSAQIKVTSEDGKVTKTYTINFTVAKSNDATLSNLQFNGSGIDNFSPTTYTYNVKLPYGTTDAPIVSAVTSDGGATVSITQASTLTGSATVVVTAEDGATNKTYTVNFTLAEASTDNNLRSITVGNYNLSPAFDPATTNYTVILPAGTSIPPAIDALLEDSTATMSIVQAKSVNDSATVVVTAQNKDVKTYTVTFKVAKSSDATLSDLTVGGVTIDNFSPATENYTVTLPYGTSIVPMVSATTANKSATANVTAASTLPGETEIVVTAEDGTTKTYSITFTVAGTPAYVTVEHLIDAIGIVSMDSGPAIAAARTAYNNLSPADQALVSNYKTLTDAETAFDTLEADNVIALIDAIGAIPTETSVDAANSAYNGLSVLQKALVPDEKKDALTAAADKLAVSLAKESLSIASTLTENITLPKTISTKYGDVIVTWASSNTAYISNDGVVTRPSSAIGNVPVVLTATITKNTALDLAPFGTTIIAEAAPKTYIVTIADPVNGAISGAGAYSDGEYATLRAIPSPNYNFNGWYAGNELVSPLPNYSFKVTSDLSLTSSFVEMPKGSLTVIAEGNGIVKMNNDSAGLAPNFEAQPVKGSSIHITATPSDGDTFAYWQDTISGSIISTQPSCDFIMGENISVKAVFVRIPTAETTQFTVIFKDKSGKILQSSSVGKGLAASPPSTPNFAGYQFTGWDKSFNNVTSDLTVNAVYKRLDTTYTVTVVNGTLSTGGTSGQFKFDMPVTVVANTAPSGQKFSYWSQDGVKISTDSTYNYFAPMNATTLEAVFVSSAVSAVNSPFITLSSDIQMDSVNKTIMFTANRSVPSGYTLVESGVLLLKSNTPLTAELTIDTANVIRGKIKNNSTNQFYIRKCNVTSGDTWYARAYLIYKDADGNVIIVYSSNTVSQTMN
ncbi:MAG: hypothetical protein Q8865_04170 [Bacillota bacterium]|nr:hypothetical protein [Bacillota bacterium]